MLAELIRHIQKNKLNIRSIIVARNDSIVLETYFHPFRQEDRTLVASVTKSIISSLIGIAVDKGFITNIDRKISDFFPEYNFRHGSGYKKEITVRHLLTMSSGLLWDDGTAQAEMMSKTNCTEYILQRPLAEKPGTVFNYNSGGAHLLSVLLTRATGMPTREFAQKYLFGPLGITDFEWKAAPDGMTTGGNLLFLKPMDMLKFGLLYLHNGNCRGRQLISASWVGESTQNRIKPPWDRADETLGYGYFWWNATSKNKPYYFSADGYGGQIIAVMPEKRLVTVITAHITGTDMIDTPYGILSQFIIPAIKSDNPLPENKTGPAELSLLCRQAENPPGAGPQTLPETAYAIAHNTYYFKANPSNLKSLKLYFVDKLEAELVLGYTDNSVTIPIGLDNLYRVCRVPRLIEKVEYFHDFIEEKVGFKGEWADNNVFIISILPLNLSVFTYYLKLGFKTRTVNLAVYRKEFPGTDFNCVGTLKA